MNSVLRKMCIYTLVVCLMFMPVEVAYASENDTYLRIEVDGVIFTSGVYTVDDYYYTVSQKDEVYIVDVYTKNGNMCVETITLYPETETSTRASGYVQRAYTNQIYPMVLNRTILTVENEVLLYIYSYDSFQQIESVLNNRVYEGDGVSSFSITSSTCSAISPTGTFPTASVNCYYSATCRGSIDVQQTFGLSVNAGISWLTNGGFTCDYKESYGTTVYFTKNVSTSWNIAVA